MSDGSSGNAFGEALEAMATNSKKALSGTITDFTKSASNQIKGSGGSSGNLSGSFTPGQQMPTSPNAVPGLTGGDLFSPDMTAGKPQQQNQQGPKPLSQAGQQLAANPDSKTPEEAAKIQQIEQEIRSMHGQYFQDFLAKAEGRDQKTQVKEQEKAQEEHEEKMEDLQKQEEKKQQSDALMRQQTASERKGGLG